MNTIGLVVEFNIFITSSVNISQPCSLCDAALLSSTVKTVFKSKTPCWAQLVKSPVTFFIPKSVSNSLKILRSDAGYLFKTVSVYR